MPERRTYGPTGELEAVVIEEVPADEAVTERHAIADLPVGARADEAEALAAAVPLFDRLVARWAHWLARRRGR